MTTRQTVSLFKDSVVFKSNHIKILLRLSQKKKFLRDIWVTSSAMYCNIELNKDKTLLAFMVHAKLPLKLFEPPLIQKIRRGLQQQTSSYTLYFPSFV